MLIKITTIIQHTMLGSIDFRSVLKLAKVIILCIRLTVSSCDTMLKVSEALLKNRHDQSMKFCFGHNEQ